MKDVITFAFDLPKDNKVRNEKGSRKVIMRNVVFAKFDAILAPMAVRIMKEKQIPLLDNDAFFLNILYNQISRSLGPKYVGNDEGKGEISKVLGSAAAPIEEAKADVMGVWNMLYKVTQKSQFQMIITFALVLLIVHPPLHPNNNNIHHNLPKLHIFIV